MAQEASVTIVMKMRDEASQGMQNFSKTTEQAAASSLNLQVTLTAVGSALTAVGSLLNQIDNPAAKMAANFLMIGGALFSTTSAILIMLPTVRTLIASLRSLAIVQAVVQALAGPAGWVTLGVGLAVAAGATAGIVALTGGFSRGGGGGTTVNINTPAFMGNDADARQFAQKVQRFAREDSRLGR